jgi:hypothetical protein
MSIKVKELKQKFSKQEINNLSIDLIIGQKQKDGDKCKKLAWLFFLNYHNSTSVFQITNPKEYQQNIKTWPNGEKKRLTTNNINKCFGVWTRTNFFDIEDHYNKNWKKGWRAKFKFNLNPLFIYAKEKNIIFSNEEKNILNLIILPTPVREFLYKNYSDINFIEAIIKYYVSFTFYHLKNPTKKKSHYFDEDFLNYLIHKNKGEIKHKFIVKRTNKEIKMLDKNHDKMKEYLTTLITNKKNYVVYESLHYFYKNIMDELDVKMLRLLLNGVPKKIK